MRTRTIQRWFFLVGLSAFGAIGVSCVQGDALVSNAFDFDTEGWLAVELPFGYALPITDSTTPGWTDEGHPGGALLIADVFAETFFAAPARYLGSQCSAFGSTLRFDILITETDNAWYPAVILERASKALYYNLPPTPVGVWTTRSIPLSGADWRLNSWTGPEASDRDMFEVLSDLQGLYINAEWHTGSDYTLLDNVLWNGSSCGDADHPYPAGDISQDCYVNLIDFSLLSHRWLSSGCDDMNNWCDKADVTFNSSVGLEDVLVLAEAWLQCTDPGPPCNYCLPLLPVFTVTHDGISSQAAVALGQQLQIPANQLIYQNGQALYFDPAVHRQLPMLSIVDEDLINALTADSENASDSPLTFEGLNFAAIQTMPIFDSQAALDRTAAAFAGAGLTPDGEPQIMHTYFEAFDLLDQAVVTETPIDTHVRYKFMLNGVPLVGPGAHVAVAYDASGNVTQLHYALRELTAGAEYPTITREQAIQEYLQSFPGQNVSTDAYLVYYAPAFDGFVTAHTILPYWDCGGTIVNEGQEVQLLRRRVPAIRDAALIPAISLGVYEEGGTIYVSSDVSAGNWGQEWSSNAADLSGYSDFSAFTILPQVTSAISRISVQLQVRNNNGVVAQRTSWISLHPPQINKPLPAEGRGVLDFGVERAVSDLGAANQAGFARRFQNAGVTQSFNLNPPDAWQRDFKAGETGLDAYFADNTDIVLYIGHGWGGAFTFETAEDSSQLQPSDVYHTWGNWDNEWMALLSCEVLKGDYNGQSWNQRWGPAFDGLHLLLGFQTLASDDPDFAPRFADYLLGRNFPGVGITVTLPVRDAWMTAKEEEQPEDREVVIMGVYGDQGVSNYQDYYWGQGQVGPDIRADKVRGYWRTVFR